jgi:hypothetical protein
LPVANHLDKQAFNEASRVLAVDLISPACDPRLGQIDRAAIGEG